MFSFYVLWTPACQIQHMCQYFLSAFNPATWQLRTAGWTLCVAYELVTVCWEGEMGRERVCWAAWQGCLSEKSELVVSFRVSCPAVSLARAEREGLRPSHNTALVLQSGNSGMRLSPSYGWQEFVLEWEILSNTLFPHSFAFPHLCLSLFHGRPQSKANKVTSVWNLRSDSSTCSSFFQFVTF